MKPEQYTILLVDDHQLVLDGLAKILSELDCIRQIVTVNSGPEALSHLLINTISLVISDIEMPGMGGIELLKKIKSSHPEVKVLILSMHNNSALTKEILGLQADGYILKTAHEKEMQFAVTDILKGKKYFSHDVTLALANKEIEKKADNKILDQLTQREKEIVSLIAQGYSTKEIAGKLFVAVKTIDTHRTNLMNKLEIHNVAGLTRFAIQHNLI